MDTQTYNNKKKNKRIEEQKEQKYKVRCAAKQFLQEQEIAVDHVDKLEVYLAGHEAWLSAVPDVQPMGLSNDLQTQPYPVLKCNMNTMAFTITEAGNNFFGITQ